MSVPLVFYRSYNLKQARSSILLPPTGFFGIVLAASNWILQIWSFLSAQCLWVMSFLSPQTNSSQDFTTVPMLLTEGFQNLSIITEPVPLLPYTLVLNSLQIQRQRIRKQTFLFTLCRVLKQWEVNSSHLTKWKKKMFKCSHMPSSSHKGTAFRTTNKTPHTITEKR